MPYSFPDNIPKVAKNWTEAEQKKCVAAANAVLSDGGSEQDAVFACIRAAGKAKNPGGEGSSQPMHWVDLFDAQQVLAGQEVLLVPLMPNGYVRGGIRRPPITAQDLQLMAANFEKRASSGYYQTNIPLNIEHEPTEGKIGTIRSFRVGEDGGYAYLELTEEGKQLLASGKFDYLSPEIRWQTEDIVTGEELGPTLVGAAVTNYPFFGDRTAMYSERAQEKLAEDMPELTPGPGAKRESLVQEILDRVLERLSSLRQGEDEGTPPAEGAEAEGTAPDTFTGGTDMPENTQPNEEGQEPKEDFAARFEALEASMKQQKEEYTRLLTEKDKLIAQQGEQLSTLAQERLAERFSREADAFTAIGAEHDALAANLMWLFQADTEEGQPHYAFFAELLKTVNAGLEQSAAFSEQGHNKPVASSDPWRRIEAAIQEKAPGAKSGTKEYSEAMNAVMREQPELMNSYRNSLVTE